MERSPEADEESRRILAELQRSEWVDDGLDYEAVMAELEEGRSAAFAVARGRDDGLSMIRMTVEESALVTRLEEIARAPWAALPTPPAPTVDLERLTGDFARTTGRRLELRLRCERYPDGDRWLCGIELDGRDVGATGIDPDLPAEELLAAIGDQVCEGWLHEEIWGGWPMCPRHPSRRMWTHVDSTGTAAWGCEADAADTTPIGRLSGG